MGKVKVVIQTANTDKGPRWILSAFDGDFTHEWPIIASQGLLFPLKREPTVSEIEAFSKYVNDPFNVEYPSIDHLRPTNG
jgi:hypothetical protein